MGGHTPFVVPADLPVAEALRRMVERRVGCAMVVDEFEQLAGIFTERDALFRIGTDLAKVATRPVSEFMTATPETIDATDPIVFCAAQNGPRRLSAFAGIE